MNANVKITRRNTLIGATTLAAVSTLRSETPLGQGSSPASAQSAANVSTSNPYTFAGGFPTQDTVTRACDDADLNRAVQAYRFFYPNVSVYGLLAVAGNREISKSLARNKQCPLVAQSGHPNTRNQCLLSG